MTLDVQFLFDNQLTSEVESLIKDSKNELLLISPFIDLDKRIMTALNEKIKNPNFKLRVLYGKNEHNIYKSVKKESIEFLMQFPDIEIRYEERLHAKFYSNDTYFIMTSMNLYGYSLAKNIESGIKVYHTSNGILGKLAEEAGGVIYSGVEKIKRDVLGMENNEIDPIIKFDQIYEASQLLYKTEPVLENEKGITGFLGKKKVARYKIITDILDSQIKKKKPLTTKAEASTKKSSKLLSGTALGKTKGKTYKEVREIMESNNYVINEEITSNGLKKGIKLKSNTKGDKWIVYPESLAEIL
jgi:F420-0:gamma-glutamyl ligase-like protein